MDVWQNQNMYDTLYLLAFGGWAVLLIVLVGIPGLLGYWVEAFRYRRIENVGIYIARFIPLGLYDLIVKLSSCLSTSLVTLSFVYHRDLLPRGLPLRDLLLAVGATTLGLIIALYLRRLLYYLWAYVYMPPERSERLEYDHLGMDFVLCIWLAVLSLIALSASTATIAFTLMCSAFALLSLMRILQTIRRLARRLGDYVYLFLYLCSHELLPWLFAGWIVVYLLEGGLIHLLDKS